MGSEVIWIFNHYAGTPDSPSTRHYDLGRQLVQKGHKIRLFASGFNHYTHAEERLAGGETSKTESFSGVSVVWIKTFPYQGNGWRRAVNMLSYAARVIRLTDRMAERPDVIIGSSVHPFAALAAYIVSRNKRAHFIFEVRDLWPQTLVDMEILSEKNLITWGLRNLERFLYRKAKRIITLLPHADEYIKSQNIPANKIVWIPNGVDMARYERLKPYSGAMNGTFTIMYLGAHGRANALNVVLDAAGILQEKGEEQIKFVFYGDGSQKMALMRSARERCLDNVTFHGPVPKSELYKVMGTADAFVLNLGDIATFRYGISSNKLFDYLAAGRPILFCVASSNNPVDEAGAGFTVPPCDPAALAAAALRLFQLQPEERMMMGKKGIKYAQENHDMKTLAERLEETIYQL